MKTKKKKGIKKLKFRVDREAVQKIQTKMLVDTKRIRALWASGYNDMEIRNKLRLDFRQWKRRIRIMRAVPPDEDTIVSYKRYYQEHAKAISKLQSRLKELKKIYRKASEEIEIFSNSKIDPKTKKQKLLYTRPRDLHLAQTTAKAMAELDKDILSAERELVTIKQKLGIIEDPNAIKNPFGEEALITMGNLMNAWALRRQRQLEARKKEIDVTPEKSKA